MSSGEGAILERHFMAKRICSLCTATQILKMLGIGRQQKSNKVQRSENGIIIRSSTQSKVSMSMSSARSTATSGKNHNQMNQYSS